MPQPSVRMVLPASQALDESFCRLRDAVRQRPDDDHRQLLRPLADHFVDEILETFFEGPMNALRDAGEEPRHANFIRGVMRAIGKAARGLAHRLMKHATPAEQRALIDHFERLRIEREGAACISIPLDDGLANRMALIFDEFAADGEGDVSHLVAVMKEMSDTVVSTLLDDTVACLRLGGFNRGLVRTARATILKSSAMASERSLPEMEASHRRTVFRYFREMLSETG